MTDELADAPELDSAPAELTEAQLEALLFVAERPLGRREIAALAGVDQATVDARLGRSRGIAGPRAESASSLPGTGSSSRPRPRPVG